MEVDLKDPGVQFALELIQFSSELANRIRTESSIRSIIKRDHSPVTLADMGIQAIAGVPQIHPAKGLLPGAFPWGDSMAGSNACRDRI